MIAALTGRLVAKAPTHITLDVHGVGYEVFIPLSTFYALPDLNETLHLHVRTHLREDALQLFGFASDQEKQAFVLLTGVSGIGPKLALSVLSTLSVADFISAVRAGDLEKLATVPGVGRKSAGRIVLELKDKVERLGGPHPSAPTGARGEQLHDDALSALVNLGCRAAEVKDAFKRLEKAGAAPGTLKDLIREALKELARG